MCCVTGMLSAQGVVILLIGREDYTAGLAHLSLHESLLTITCQAGRSLQHAAVPHDQVMAETSCMF